MWRTSLVCFDRSVNDNTAADHEALRSKKSANRQEYYVATKAVHACMYVFNMVRSCTQWHTTLYIVYNRGAVAICFGSKPSLLSVYSTVSALPVSFLGFRRDSITGRTCPTVFTFTGPMHTHELQCF